MSDPPNEYGEKTPKTDGEPLSPLNKREKSGRATAVALKDRTTEKLVPSVMAAGRGKIAEKIIELAYANGINVREDRALAEMLTKVELDSPIPSEAFMAVAEILSYVYQASGKPNPFDAVIEETDTAKN